MTERLTVIPDNTQLHDLQQLGPAALEADRHIAHHEERNAVGRMTMAPTDPATIPERFTNGQKVDQSNNHNDRKARVTQIQPSSKAATSSAVPSILSQEPQAETSQSDKTYTDQPEEHEPIPVMDEAAIIEERRKRREAMRDKYRGQATPLLVQALHLNADSNRDTPGPTASEGASPAASTLGVVDNGSPRSRELTPASPRSPQVNSQASPARSSGQDDMFADGDPEEDGPSAADYDPTADMQDERARHDSRLFKEDDKSIEEAEKQVEIHASIEGDEAPPKAREFDMFADDDDDDMFAEEAPARPSNATAVAPKGAQALDARLMDNWDDHEGYYITILGELIDNRYSVTDTLGRGMFASVIRATDSKTNMPVAIKIVRNNESMRKAGAKELDILQNLAANDPDDKKHVVRLLRSFDHKGHLCMVFENMSMNLREVLKKFGRDIGINIKAIRAYSQQLMLGLSLLKKCQYIHADLKPDNILANDAHNLIKIADLGSASPITENATAPYLVSRFYRAPEVILGIPYDFGIDMWSVGCTLFELYTGKILFTGRNNNNMLRAIMDCRGKFPHKLLRRGALIYEHFDDLLNFRSQETDKVTGRVVMKLVDIKAKPVRDLRSRLMPKGKKMDDQERKELEMFLDLLDKCLDLRPEKRITPTEALKHPFIMRPRV
ncbi:Serine/threonine-protein kinase prp4 [Cyphellophora attinorum]|uniref:non-specific serine/threonine protein kinase n=1 Tax=Cyphellophora attinorum TaxID=1664694 RepID=A0A0N1HEY3_9EURO|nr:Serine/threonine-protein kinase prp4 [Phialophora attinorum]KPI44147.1 Serine/threonine-protein kinase prp4 [Phialophora attinorum]